VEDSACVVQTSLSLSLLLGVTHTLCYCADGTYAKYLPTFHAAITLVLPA
jgi:hypothetical protein